MGIIHDKNMVFLKLLVLLIVSLGIRSTKGEFVEVRINKYLNNTCQLIQDHLSAINRKKS